jgi:misacylated tRNA(Ala) deacylase
MTKRLFHNDQYLKQFQAHVVRSEGDAILLDQTAFYPGGGGQPADIGSIRSGDMERQVIKLSQRGNEIWHHLDSPALDLDVVEGQIDWDRRFKLMRTHSAMHVLCGVVWRDYGASVTGGNMKLLQGRMDFEFENMARELIDEIENKINIEVSAGGDIVSRVLPREEAFQIPDLIRTKINLLPEGIRQVRVVEIKGLDLQADGGTHVRNTADIGRIKIIDYKSKGKINKRIVVSLEA